MKIQHFALLGITFLTLMSFSFLQYTEEDEPNYYSSDYIITYGQAGPFTLNSAFPGKEGEYMGYQLVQRKQIRYAEDGADTLTTFHAQKDGITHIIIHPKYNNDALIGGLEVVSALYETKHGVGVGSSLYDFYAIYPDAKGYYTFVSDMYWVEYPVMEGIQFLIDAKACKTEPDAFSDLTVIEKSNLNLKSRITGIRIF
ncbi:hypothetical protein BC781_101568 [Sediminitomix flava]|uniref:Uncharacterized protein n=2 Tax=Sediminitomix flava TaxID=379075 RepID=A0A315ZHE8_SEDFL|nr:hypothetical protein BC781_101568 [Sediminitomix flava]